MTIFTAGQNITATGLQNLEKNFAASSAPGTPVTGQLWYDTGTSILKVYNGSSWIAAGTGSGGGANVAVADEGSTLTSAATSVNFVGSGVTATNVGSAVTVTIGGGSGGCTVSATAPGSPSDGALWYDTINARLYVYISASSVWVDASPGISGGGGGSGGGSGGGPTNKTVFTKSGTWTAPSGVTAAWVYVYGGGGGGAPNTGPNSSSNGYDGAAAYAYVPVTAGTSYTITVGNGGNSTNWNGTGSGTGGTSSFDTLVSCTGGYSAASGSGPGTATFATGSGVVKLLSNNRRDGLAGYIYGGTRGYSSGGYPSGVGGAGMFGGGGGGNGGGDFGSEFHVARGTTGNLVSKAQGGWSGTAGDAVGGTTGSGPGGCCCTMVSGGGGGAGGVVVLW